MRNTDEIPRVEDEKDEVAVVLADDSPNGFRIFCFFRNVLFLDAFDWPLSPSAAYIVRKEGELIRRGKE